MNRDDTGIRTDLSQLRAHDGGNHAHRRLHLFSRVCRLSYAAAPKGGRLLRLLFVRVGEVSAGPAGAQLLRQRLTGRADSAVKQEARAVMTESELTALFDAHDALVTGYIDSILTFAEFVSAYDDFPHNYSLDAHSATAEERAVLRFFARRIAFHLRVSGIVSADIPYGDAGSFLPAVALKRLRELVARYPEFRAEPAF